MSSAVSISKSRLVVTPIMGTTQKQKLKDKSLKNLIRNNEYNGYISRPTVKKIGEMVENLIFGIELFRKENKRVKGASSIQPTFVTLTLSSKQNHEDNEIKRQMFSRFIEIMQKEKGVQNYIWRAEPQKNGNIHFHIIMDRFVEWQFVQERWNKLQARLGYIDKFEMKFGHRNPNSTDVHSLRKVENIAAYLCKYMTKNEPARKIEGRIWGCSKNFHGAKNPRVEIFDNVIEDLEELVKSGKVFRTILEYCTIFRYKKNRITQTINNFIYNTYKAFVLSVVQIQL